jgi:membrane protease YdiL (CAAX protease family)
LPAGETPSTEAPADPAPYDAGERRRLWFELLVVLSVGCVPQLVGAIQSLAEKEPVVLGSVRDNVWLLTTALSTIVPLLYVCRRSGEGPESAGLARTPWLALLVGSFAIWAVQRWIYAYMWVALPGHLPSREVVLHRPAGAAEVALLCVATFMSAFAEELAMRGVLIDRLVRLSRAPVLSVVIAALFFGSYHVYQGLHGALWASVFGFIQGLVFLVTRRLWPLVLGHALCNLELFLG